MDFYTKDPCVRKVDRSAGTQTIMTTLGTVMTVPISPFKTGTVVDDTGREWKAVSVPRRNADTHVGVINSLTNEPHYFVNENEFWIPADGGNSRPEYWEDIINRLDG